MIYVFLQRVCVTGHLEGEVGDDAGDSEANQQQVGEDESSSGVDDLLDLLVGSARLAGLPCEGQRGRMKSFEMIGLGFIFFSQMRF